MTTTLHPHSRTHSSTTGSVLPNLAARGGFLGAHEDLCFDARSFARKSADFDPHEFVTHALAATNPAFKAQNEREERAAVGAGDAAAASAVDGSNDLSLLPVHAASPSVPLELLREHLTSYQLHIKNELIELLNTEYADFIGLSSSLSGVDTRLHSIQGSLQGLSREVGDLHRRIADETLRPFETKLVDQYLAEQRKQNYIHAVLHILEQMRSNDTQLKANEEEEAGAGQQSHSSESKQKESDESTSPPPASFFSPTHTRLVQHHLSTSRAHQLQRLSEAKKRRASSAAAAATSTSSYDDASSYDGLQINIPLWMLRQGASGRRVEEDDDDDEDDDEDEEIPPLEDSNQNDAFGLYQALLNVPTTEAMYAHSLDQNASTAVTTAAVPAPLSFAVDHLSSLTSRLIRLERVAHSMLSLTQLQRACSHFNLVRDLRNADGVSGALDQLEARLHRQARDAFREVLELLSSNSSATSSPPPQLYGLVRTALRIFTFLDANTAAEEAVRAHLVAPALAKCMQAASLRTNHITDETAYWTAHAKATQDPLRDMYARIMQFVRGPLSVLIECAQRHYPILGDVVPAAASWSAGSDAGAPAILRFSFLSRAFFVEFAQRASSDLGALLFSTGLPHIFHDHFRSTRDFREQLETFARELDRDDEEDDETTTGDADEHDSFVAGGHLSQLHGHASWSAFDKKWNLSIYYQVRFQQIATALENAVIAAKTDEGIKELAQPAVQVQPLPSHHSTPDTPLSTLASYSGCLRLPWLQQLWSSLLACFSEHTFLDELGHRFVKLSTQCIARAAKHAEEVTRNPTTDTPILLLMHADWQRLTQTLLPQHLLPVALGKLEARALAPEHIQSVLAQQLAQPIAAGTTDESAFDDETILRLVTSSFAPTLRRCAALLESVHSRLVDLVASQCRESLQCVSRISTAYRGTRRKLPTRPFQYVRAVVAPLSRHLLAADRADLTDLIRDATEEQGRKEREASEWMADDTDAGADGDALPFAISAPTASSLLTVGARTSFLRLVVARVCVEYASKSRDCLTDVSRFEDLSKKLGKRGATSGTTATGDMTDSEKTRKQIELDATHFARLVQAHDESEQVRQLLQPLLQTTRATTA